jgi:hypothetical protein
MTLMTGLSEFFSINTSPCFLVQLEILLRKQRVTGNQSCSGPFLAIKIITLMDICQASADTYVNIL